MTKTDVIQSNRDVDKLKPHLKMRFQESNLARRETVAKIKEPDPIFRKETSNTIFHFLFAGIAATNPATPADRIKTPKMLKKCQAAIPSMEAVCLTWEGYSPLHDDLCKALVVLKRLENIAALSLAELKEFKRGAKPYHAFEKFVVGLAQHYESATGQEAVVNLNNGRGYDERCSGSFADLIEECFDQSKEIWTISGFEKLLPAPATRGGRLEYARKALHKRNKIGKGRKSNNRRNSRLISPESAASLSDSPCSHNCGSIPRIEHGRPTMHHASVVSNRLLRRAEAAHYTGGIQAAHELSQN